MKRIKRRDFLRGCAGAAVGLGAANLLKGCGNGGTNGHEYPAEVAAVRGRDLQSMTNQALDKIGGIDKIVKAGESVFIKPNFVTAQWAGPQYSPWAIGECTKPEIVVATAEACLQAGASKVTIGDGAQWPTFDWSMARYLDNSTNLAQEAERLNGAYSGQVSLVCDADATEWVEVPSTTALETISVYKVCASADRIISIPVAKTHNYAQLTLATKNFIGVTPLDKYGILLDDSYYLRGLLTSHENFQELVLIWLEIFAGLRPDLAIVDMSIGVEADGPGVGENAGKTVDMRERLGDFLVLASTDSMAADATAARIMSHTVEDMLQLTMGRDMGLGIIDQESIGILGEKLEDLIVPWEPAVLIYKKKATLGNLGCPYARKHGRLA
jgi:uncharacterized protein (DUF362 family)